MHHFYLDVHEYMCIQSVGFYTQTSFYNHLTYNYLVRLCYLHQQLVEQLDLEGNRKIIII